MESEFIERIKILLTSFTDEDKITFLKQLERNINLVSCNTAVESLFKFVKSKNKLKLTEACIPKKVLLQSLTGSLYDVRINGHGPDDKIYASDKDFREKITRGLTFLQLSRNNKPLPLDLVIYANRKFSGGAGDDDDFLPEDDQSWQMFFLESPDEACRIVSCHKLNGEAGHFAGRFIEGKFYFFIGSKNVHLMVKSVDEISLYTDSRYSIARIVAKAVLTAVDRLTPESRCILKDFLDRTRVTFVCEVLQPEFQHIVDLSYLKEPIVQVVTITPNAGTDSGLSLTAFSPHLTLQFCKLIGLHVTDYTVVHSDQLQKEILTIRRLQNLEGNVLYFMNSKDDSIGLCKVKTYWYVLLRAMREKAVHGFNGRNPSCVNDVVNRTKKRFAEIQDWLKFEDSILSEWQDMAEEFLKWLDNRIKLKKLKPGEIRPKYPIIWNEFNQKQILTTNA